MPFKKPYTSKWLEISRDVDDAVLQDLEVWCKGGAMDDKVAKVLAKIPAFAAVQDACSKQGCLHCLRK